MTSGGNNNWDQYYDTSGSNNAFLELTQYCRRRINIEEYIGKGCRCRLGDRIAALASLYQDALKNRMKCKIASEARKSEKNGPMGLRFKSL